MFQKKLNFTKNKCSKTYLQLVIGWLILRVLVLHRCHTRVYQTGKLITASKNWNPFSGSQLRLIPGSRFYSLNAKKQLFLWPKPNKLRIFRIRTILSLLSQLKLKYKILTISMSFLILHNKHSFFSKINMILQRKNRLNIRRISPTKMNS